MILFQSNGSCGHFFYILKLIKYDILFVKIKIYSNLMSNIDHKIIIIFILFLINILIFLYGNEIFNIIHK
jgi:hypothetical protein